jgi:hypothetical protein
MARSQGLIDLLLIAAVIALAIALVGCSLT